MSHDIYAQMREAVVAALRDAVPDLPDEVADRVEVTPARAAAQYAQALGGECELALLPDAGHWPWLDRGDVVERVANFLAQS